MTVSKTVTAAVIKGIMESVHSVFCVRASAQMHKWFRIAALEVFLTPLNAFAIKITMEMAELALHAKNAHSSMQLQAAPVKPEAHRMLYLAHV